MIAVRSARYTQADPLSLAGGMNLYSYASRNPVNYIDPWGLVTWTQGAPVYRSVNQDTVYRQCKDFTAAGCTIPFVSARCECSCTSGGYSPKIALRMTMDVWARNDDPRAPLTQILLEEEKHVRYFKVMFKWAIKRGEQLEAQKFSNKSDCDAACQAYYAGIKRDFEDDWVHRNNPHPKL